MIGRIASWRLKVGSPRVVSSSSTISRFSLAVSGLSSTSTGPASWALETSERLTHSQIGSLTLQDWSDAKAAMQWWTDEQTTESVHHSLKLLGRLVQEEEGEDSQASLLNTEWLNRVVDNWRICWRITQQGIQPPRMIQELDDWTAQSECLQPNVQTYSMILDAAAYPGNTQLALALLNRIVQESIYNPDVRPDIVTFHTVLVACVNTGELQQAEDLLEFIKEDDTLQPIRDTFHILIFAWQKRATVAAAERAEALLEQMHHLASLGNDHVRPNQETYNAVMDCWAKSGQPNAAERVQALLQNMQDRYEHQGDASVRPDIVSFNTLLNAIALGKHGSSERLAAVLKDMHDFAQRTGDSNLLPDTTTFTSMIKALANSGRKGAPQQAEDVLQQMHDGYERGHYEAKPTTLTYNAVIDSWAKSRNPRAAERALAILAKMQHLYQQGDTRVKPDAFSYSLVIRALAQSGKRGSAQTAQELLEDMENSKDPALQPTTIVYTNVINCWAKSGEEDAPERAESLLERMQDLYKSGNDLVKPDKVSYNSVIHCWAKSKGHTSARRAESVLYRMQQAHNHDGDEATRPNAISYSAVIDAYATKSHGSKTSPMEAERILRQMWKQYESGNVDCCPNVRSYTSVITAWSRSRHVGAVDRAQALLTEMLSTKKANLTPDSMTFGAMLVGLHKSKQIHDKSKRLSRLLGIMKQIGVAPNKFHSNLIDSIKRQTSGPDSK